MYFYVILLHNWNFLKSRFDWQVLLFAEHRLQKLTLSGRKIVFIFFWPITGSRWHLNVVVWFRCFSLVAISISRGLCGLFFRIIVRSNIVYSALQCTLFFVTPVKRPLLNYHFFPDIRLDWESYNILPQDNQLLDMLVFVGQPLPVIQDGQEVVPALQEQDCYLCEEKPFIQVKLREHEGIRANRPFEVTPSQQVWYTVSC